MPNTYTPITTTTVTATGVNTINLTGIPNTYTDLILVASVQGNSNARLAIYVNSDYNTVYSQTSNQGNNGSTSPGSNNATYPYIGYARTAISPNVYHFANYANTNVYKTIMVRSGTGVTLSRHEVMLWPYTTAISSLEIQPTSNTFVVGSTFSLYGIKAA